MLLLYSHLYLQGTTNVNIFDCYFLLFILLHLLLLCRLEESTICFQGSYWNRHPFYKNAVRTLFSPFSKFEKSLNISNTKPISCSAHKNKILEKTNIFVLKVFPYLQWFQDSRLLALFEGIEVVFLSFWHRSISYYIL